MPILLKEFEFTESESQVYLEIQMKGVTPLKTDIYCNDLYLKVNSPPFFFELDLKFPIDSEESLASLGENCVKFTLKKVE